MKHFCECGRPALVMPRGRRRRLRYMADHDLCWRCWKALRAREATKSGAERKRAQQTRTA